MTRKPPSRWVWEPLYMAPFLWIGVAVVLGAIGYVLFQSVLSDDLIPFFFATVVATALIVILRKRKIRSARLR